jgi:hypothetical protein
MMADLQHCHTKKLLEVFAVSPMERNSLLHNKNISTFAVMLKHVIRNVSKTYQELFDYLLTVKKWLSRRLQT